VHSVKKIMGNLLPGVALPGLIYLIVSRHAPVLVALAAASSVPLLDTAYRLLRGRKPSAAGLVFLAVTATSIGLAMWLRSPMLILARGALISTVMGAAFAISAAIRRPLTRTVAIVLSEEAGDARRRLRERWAHPKVLSVFRVLAVFWGAILLMQAAQQVALILTVSPGTVMAVEPPAQGIATIVGIALSILYVRRKQRAHAEVQLLPVA
jgi:hypothetical protein